MTLASGLLMVSNVRYHSFKELNFSGKVPFVVSIIVMLVLALVYVAPPVIIFVIFLLYTLSGLWLTANLLRRKRRDKKNQSDGN